MGLTLGNRLVPKAVFTNSPLFTNKFRPIQFPTSQKTPTHMARHDLGNWEMARGTYFPISQIIPAQMAQHHLGNWEVGKLVEVCTSQFPKKKKPAHLAQHYLGNWEIGRGIYFPISYKILAQMAQHYLRN